MQKSITMFGIQGIGEVTPENRVPYKTSCTVKRSLLRTRSLPIHKSSVQNSMKIKRKSTKRNGIYQTTHPKPNKFNDANLTILRSMTKHETDESLHKALQTFKPKSSRTFDIDFAFHIEVSQLMSFNLTLLCRLLSLGF